MVPDSIKQTILQGQIWNAAIDEDRGVLFLDVRKEKERTIELFRLQLADLNIDSKKVDHSWWTQLLSAQNDELFFIEYQDNQDPNKSEYFRLDWTGENKIQLEEIPKFGDSVIHPSIYEHGSDYHQTVAEFLALELPLSCEYLEWNDKIIISYYLRSANGFDRYLLLLNRGEKEWKIQQDDKMNGFSPGSFFVFKDQLLFIKDRNEVCVYTG